MSIFTDVVEWLRDLRDKFQNENNNRRREDRDLDEEENEVDPKSEEPLRLDVYDLYIQENAKRQKTEKYELVQKNSKTVVLRRANTFYMVIRFKERNFDKDKDFLRLIFNFGPRPNPIKGTRANLLVTGSRTFKSENDKWGIRLHGQDEYSVTLDVRVPSDAPVGLWKCQVQMSLKNVPESKRLHKCKEDIFILFNPWSKEDAVYMQDEEQLEEYVLNDSGKIWVGPYGSSRGRPWVFGQFDDVVLPATMIMLEYSGIPHTARGNPILVSRGIVKMINSNDYDNGVLVGRWDGEYEDGTAPAAWTGSVKILEEYLHKQIPVRYAQCWVFSGVTTTICRALGLPCRSVSNLVSAHDANRTLSIDKYYDIHNEEIRFDPQNPNGGHDSIWNFHVWNDVWMARPDLPKGFGGWQAIDATPQEQSQGFFQVGPASVEAVRRGEVGHAYDVHFVLSEVNADYCRWREDPDEDIGFVIMDTNKYHVGRQLLTKKPVIYDPNGELDREDITLSYKNIEGSESERLALYNGIRGTTRAKRFFRFPTSSKEDVVFNLVEIERVPIGKGFSIAVSLINQAEDIRTVSAVLAADSVFYTGVKAQTVKRASGVFIMQPQSREELQLRVKVDEYMNKLVEYGIMKIYTICFVKETHQTWSDEDDFQILKPVLNIKVNETLRMGQPANVKFTFTNPLQVQLTNCQIRYEGPGLARNKIIEQKDVPAGAEMSYTHKFTPRRPGQHNMVATFTSKELLDITGSTTVTVTN